MAGGGVVVAAVMTTSNVLAEVTLGFDAPRLAFMPNILPIARDSTLGLLQLTRVLAVGKGPLGRFDGQTPMLARPRAGDLHWLADSAYQQEKRNVEEKGREGHRRGKEERQGASN